VGDERVLSSLIRFNGLKSGSREASLIPESAKMVTAYQCHERKYRNLQNIEIMSSGRMLSKGAQSGEVLPNSPQELAMDYACSSFVGRLWLRSTRYPVIRDRD
jgi:hypothetical protein